MGAGRERPDGTWTESGVATTHASGRLDSDGDGDTEVLVATEAFVGGLAISKVNGSAFRLVSIDVDFISGKSCGLRVRPSSDFYVDIEVEGTFVFSGPEWASVTGIHLKTSSKCTIYIDNVTLSP